MNGSVTNLCDIDAIAIPAEMLELKVDERRVEEGVRALALRCAAEREASSAERGDVVHCTADAAAYPDGRTILIFTGAELPGAEEAAAAVLGAHPGDRIVTTLAGKGVELSIGKIIRRTPVEVNDALIASLGIDGVGTVDEYRAYLRGKALADLALERHKEINRFFMDKLMDESEYAYDETEFEKYFEDNRSLYTPGDDEMSGNASDDELKAAVLGQLKQAWVAEAFCKSRGIEISRADAEADAAQMKEMLELMGEAVPPEEELIEMSLQNMFLDALFDYMDGIVDEKMGGSDGNA